MSVADEHRIREIAREEIGLALFDALNLGLKADDGRDDSSDDLTHSVMEVLDSTFVDPGDGIEESTRDGQLLRDVDATQSAERNVIGNLQRRVAAWVRSVLLGHDGALNSSPSDDVVGSPTVGDRTTPGDGVEPQSPGACECVGGPT